jgi:hypothetical protein
MALGQRAIVCGERMTVAGIGLQFRRTFKVGLV